MFVVIILFTSIIMLTAVRYSYSTVMKAHGGRLLSFSFEPSQLRHPEVEKLCECYRKELKKLLWVCVFALIPLIFIINWYLSVFLLLYVLWCLLLCLGCSKLVKKYTRKLCQLKSRLGWYPFDDYSYTTNPEKNQKLSTKIPSPVDMEPFWEKGHYENVRDPRILVSSPVTSATNMSYTLNMGRTGSKVLYALFWLLILGLPIGLSAMFFRMDFIPYEMRVENQTLVIDAPSYSTEFPLSSIESARLLEELPKHYLENISRTNGADTSRYLLGNFRSRVMGKMKLYYYTDYLPVIEIRQSDYTVLFNTKNPEKTRTIYEMLDKKLTGK